MSRAEFSKSTKAAAFARADNYCEYCGISIRNKKFHYDHANPEALSKDNSLENCRVACESCHATKTNKGNGLRRGDKTEIAKAVRGFEKRIGAREKRGPPMFGSKRSGWRKPMSGPPVRRESR